MKPNEFKRRGGTAAATEAYVVLRDRHATPRTVHDPDLKALGRELRVLRLAAGLTLRAMAVKVGVSAPFLCDVEHGRRCLSAAHGAIFLATCAGPARLGGEA